jgi:hypothetical protein
LIHGIEPHLPAAEVDVAATAFLAMVEGTFRLGLGTTERHGVIRYGLERIPGIR